jgi:hypothetical protein
MIPLFALEEVFVLHQMFAPHVLEITEDLHANSQYAMES